MKQLSFSIVYNLGIVDVHDAYKKGGRLLD